MKNILIVGASSSIGNTIIKKFHSATTNIVATYNSKNCIESGENIYPMFLDLTDDKSIKNFVFLKIWLVFVKLKYLRP